MPAYFPVVEIEHGFLVYTVNRTALSAQVSLSFSCHVHSVTASMHQEVPRLGATGMLWAMCQAEVDKLFRQQV